jgi:pimeloyl-ACP methyl ester carboxylesterase
MSLRSLATRRGLLGILTAVVTIGGVQAVPALAGGHHGPTGLHRVWVRRGHYRIAAYEQAGTGPAIVLCHGFPDNHHLYDLTLPYLKGRRVVSFDFLGWGASDKPAGYKYTFAGQVADLNAVISQLHLGKVLLVGHDASVPTVINWTLDHPGRVQSLVLANGFYAPVQESGAPALTGILSLGQYPSDAPLGPWPAGSAHGLHSLVDELGRNPQLFRALFDWEEGTFFRSAKVAAAFIPLFRAQFLTRPSSYGAIRSLAADAFATAAADAGRVPQLAALGRFTHIVWGAQDPDINLHIAKSLHSDLVGSTLTILRHAHHNVMLDEPAAFASAILSR